MSHSNLDIQRLPLKQRWLNNITQASIKTGKAYLILASIGLLWFIMVKIWPYIIQPFQYINLTTAGEYIFQVPIKLDTLLENTGVFITETLPRVYQSIDHALSTPLFTGRLMGDPLTYPVNFLAILIIGQSIMVMLLPIACAIQAKQACPANASTWWYFFTSNMKESLQRKSQFVTLSTLWLSLIVIAWIWTKAPEVSNAMLGTHIARPTMDNLTILSLCTCFTIFGTWIYSTIQTQDIADMLKKEIPENIEEGEKQKLSDLLNTVDTAWYINLFSIIGGFLTIMLPIGTFYFCEAQGVPTPYELITSIAVTIFWLYLYGAIIRTLPLFKNGQDRFEETCRRYLEKAKTAPAADG